MAFEKQESQNNKLTDQEKIIEEINKIAFSRQSFQERRNEVKELIDNLKSGEQDNTQNH